MLQIGQLVDGKYKILNKVGQGGMSVVYLAMNEKANKQWAIKEVRKDGVKDFEVVKQGLVVETDMLKRLSHPSLPSIIDVIEDEDTFLIVMDYIEGNPLSKILEEYGAQPQKNVIEWAKQLCDVLGYLHTRHPAIIYRDMKPGNVMLKPDGKVTLIDFGTAREFKEKNLADTTCLGTVGYAAPEQFGGMGQTDARTDIYCLGATLYHLVTGMNPCEPPYEIKPIRSINPMLSSGLERIILKCTQRNPEDRYQSCAELMYALEHYEEIDDIYRRRQVKKIAAFAISSILTIGCGITSAWGYTSAEKKKSENYFEILKTADSAEDYYDAILTDPVKKDAYIQLNDFLIEDYVLTSDEGQKLKQLQIGLDQKNNRGFSERVDVFNEFRESNRDDYIDVCYAIGESFLFSYDVSVDMDRYVNAASWFESAKEKYPITDIYCDMADCLEAINQYGNAKVKQTEKMYEQYKVLWEQIKKLEQKTEQSDGIDSKIQVWNEINNIINHNIMQFLDITDLDQIKALLEQIDQRAETVNESVVQEDIKNLRKSISESIKKINSAEEIS